MPVFLPYDTERERDERGRAKTVPVHRATRKRILHFKQRAPLRKQ